jgi:coproporphyrinogen III oxidase-like Fe-S oxidoreductase
LSVAAAREAIPHRAYADAVLRDLAARLPLLGADVDYRLQTVFFGGGTPSLWATDELGRVLEAILDAALLRWRSPPSATPPAWISRKLARSAPWA